MRNYLKYGLIVVLSFVVQGSFAQRQIYTTSGGEMIWQMADVDNGAVETNVRWTVFLHLGSYTHMDFGNRIGFFSGLALRNVGYISDPVNDPVLTGVTGPFKVIRRTYNLGVPLALKVGLFEKQFFVFGGGEYEWQFCYKEKYWGEGDGERDGAKTKDHEWFSDKVNQFIPSVFIGIQLPRGVNVKYKVYLENYMASQYGDVKLSYVSVSWNIRNSAFTGSSQNSNNYTYLTK